MGMVIDVVLLHEMPGCKVERHPGNVVIKSGRRIHLDEVDALRLAVQIGLPVPRVHGINHMANGEIGIRMDFIMGQTLDQAWPNMSEIQKSDIAQQLREILQAMRSINSTTGVIGSCRGGLVRDCRRISDYTGGPFADEESFNKFILDLAAATPIVIRHGLARRLRSNHQIVFTHGDLAQHNILVKDGMITGVIDWEYAGWYPEYWEYVKFFERYSKNRDWKDYAEYIFPQKYDDELLDYQALARWQLP